MPKHTHTAASPFRVLEPGQNFVVVIPVHDVNPVRRTPYVTYVLIAANFVVFLATPGVASSLTGESGLAQLCHLQAFPDHWAAVPRELIHGQTPTTVPTGDVGVGSGGPGCVVGPPGYDKSPPCRSSRRCSCTAAGCTCSATCSSC